MTEGGSLPFTWCCYGDSGSQSCVDDLFFIVVVTQSEHPQSWLKKFWTPVLKLCWLWVSFSVWNFLSETDPRQWCTGHLHRYAHMIAPPPMTLKDVVGVCRIETFTYESSSSSTKADANGTDTSSSTDNNKERIRTTGPDRGLTPALLCNCVRRTAAGIGWLNSVLSCIYQIKAWWIQTADLRSAKYQQVHVPYLG